MDVYEQAWNDSDKTSKQYLSGTITMPDAKIVAEVRLKTGLHPLRQLHLS